METLKNNYIDYTQQIKNFYKNYNIEIEISKIIDSYSITRYFITLTRTNKIKISNIENLIDDLSVELNVKNIKFNIDFETGGIVFEIPKKIRKNLYFKDIKHSINTSTGLNVCFGKDLNNNDFNVDLCTMPHLLVAGTTGSGKSMFINTILCHLLTTYTHEQLELFLIDPKKVELSIYNNIEHVKNVATNLSNAKELLKNVLKEINNRYKLLEINNVRNIDNYNKKASNKLSYQLIVIDELADIIIQDKNNKKNKKDNSEMFLEDLIVRIAQIGRACGVHLIVATQRPSSDVITGLIKANIPSRVAFSVSSKIDSRIILDEKGAEKLTGKGDMLVKIVGDEELHRIQGAYISDEEVEGITNDLRTKNTNTISTNIKIAQNGNTEQLKAYNNVQHSNIKQQKEKDKQTAWQITWGVLKVIGSTFAIAFSGIVVFISACLGAKPR